MWFQIKILNDQFSRISELICAGILLPVLFAPSPAIARGLPDSETQSASQLLPLRPADWVQPQSGEPTPPFLINPQLRPSRPPHLETVLNQIGLLKQVSPGQMTVRAINGNDKTYSISSQLKTFPNMKRGTLVSYRLEQNQVAEVKLPVVKNMFEGVLIVIENNVLGIVSAAGERKYTQLSPGKISSLRLTPGQTVQVLEFEGIRTTVICAPQMGKRSPIYIGELEGALQSF